jgi:hypothetical protein
VIGSQWLVLLGGWAAERAAPFSFERKSPDNANIPRAQFVKRPCKMEGMSGMARARLLVGMPILIFAIAACTTIFVQAQTNQPASSQSSSSSKQGRKPTPAAVPKLDPGVVSAGVYRNLAFGFTCRIPSGWVLRTEEMNQQQGEDEQADAGKKATDAGRVLLATFSRPPEARGEDVNSSMVIAAESAAAYPGLKDAAQYFGPLTEVTKARGLEVVEEPYEFVIGAKTVVRGDFKKDVGARVIRQSTLVVLARGYVVSFTFIGGSEDEVEELVKGLSFGASAKPAK